MYSEKNDWFSYLSSASDIGHFVGHMQLEAIDKNRTFFTDYMHICRTLNTRPPSDMHLDNSQIKRCTPNTEFFLNK